MAADPVAVDGSPQSLLAAEWAAWRQYGAGWGRGWRCAGPSGSPCLPAAISAFHATAGMPACAWDRDPSAWTTPPSARQTPGRLLTP
jgi:hypothetical protein